MSSIDSAVWIRANTIAAARNVSKKTVHNWAEEGNWPSRTNGNRLEYQPPAEIAALCGVEPAAPVQEEEKLVRFVDLKETDPTYRTVRLREKAVLQIAALASFGKDRALRIIASNMLAQEEGFNISPRSLQRWEQLYKQHGIDGLVDQKKGRVGRKSALADLTPEQLDEFVNETMALAIEKGSGGTPNIAKAIQHQATNVNLPAPLRRHIHSAHASKSHVTKSIREAVRPAQITTESVQIGKRYAEMHGAWTPGDYSEVKAGQVVTADDMTANVYVWSEWANPEGFILMRPQILAALDVGSMKWIVMRGVLRAKGQYNKDDVWGLVGDVLDLFVPESFLFEGGTWRSNAVMGVRTQLSDDFRIGGLAGLGIKLRHSRLPRSKHIETMFNQLQYSADNCKGFCGREERVDCPEAVKKQKYLVQSGKSHPREFFMHISEYLEHLQKVMAELNNERQDGKILRGMTPNEKWEHDAPEIKQFPESSKWKYRSAFSIVTVGSNGVAVTQRSGKYKQTHHYDNPLVLRQLQNRRVIVFWNDSNPNADAVIMSIKPGNQVGDFLGIAKYTEPLPRFSATKEQLSEEAARKKLSAHVAVVQTKAIAPHLQRNYSQVPQSGPEAIIGDQISRSNNRAAVTQTRASQMDQVRRKVAAQITQKAKESQSSREGDSAPTLTVAPDQERIQLHP